MTSCILFFPTASSEALGFHKQIEDITFRILTNQAKASSPHNTKIWVFLGLRYLE